MELVTRNINEISKSRWLRFFGVALALTHVFTFLFWVNDADYFTILAGKPSICWPFLSHCDNPSVRGLFGREFLCFYFSLAIMTAAQFLRRTDSSRKLAWYGLATLTVLKSLVLLQDYRLMGNYNYMQLLVSLAFLFLPVKEQLIPRFIVFFYFWAGTLKLNQEWLSGNILTNTGLSPGWLHAACAYAVFLELFLAWGLLSRKKWVLIPTLAQFVLFHAFSYQEVGFFYPLVMFSLDSCFLLRFIYSEENTEEPEPLVKTWLATPRSAAIVLALFSGMQLIPYLHPGDTALTSEGRIFALSMLDANTRCQARMSATWGNSHSEVGALIPALQPRIQCDPAVFYSYIKSMCQTGRQFAPDYSISLDLKSKRSTDPGFHSIVDEKDMCRDELRLHIWKANDWIHDRKIAESPPSVSR